jgi:hypothetical protein
MTNNLKVEGFILAHSFRMRFKFIVLGSIDSGMLGRQNTMETGKCGAKEFLCLIADRKQR